MHSIILALFILPHAVVTYPSFEEKCDRNRDKCVPAADHCGGGCKSGCQCAPGCWCNIPIGAVWGTCGPHNSDPNRGCCLGAWQCKKGCECHVPFGADTGTCVTPGLTC
ncbi:hypothetical protein BFJ69_g16533 [Fusarium oxysporum]|uniref:Uncharacterized protein n=1 Tax=Fusarium oxysporum TaxID=5507 RepID=A0A420MAW6_FUSOX|nr:hypothetical protein BFJ69_g16533 [Fusarium oxysporum]